MPPAMPNHPPIQSLHVSHAQSLHEFWMYRALDQAKLAAQHGDVPVGCVIVSENGHLLSQGHNQRELLQDPTAHAEVVALRNAARNKGHWRIENATLYVTLEPCPMCAGAIVNARIKTLVFGCRDPKAGACVSLMHITSDNRLNHQARIVEGILADACAKQLQQFFATLRKQRKK